LASHARRVKIDRVAGRRRKAWRQKLPSKPSA
jgi:hypothetical protein